jgi:LPXTG-motif cell wall-anchored protein
MAQTGSDTVGVATFGAGLLVLGVTMVVGGRRRDPA